MLKENIIILLEEFKNGLPEGALPVNKKCQIAPTE